MIAKMRGVAIELILLVCLFVGWWLLSSHSTNIFFPSLGSILKNLQQNWFFAKFGPDLVPSLAHFIIGFAIAVVLGVGVGTVLGLLTRLRTDLFPEIEFLRSMPIAALVPVALVILGPGASMEITLIAFGSVWPILVNTIDGMKNVDTLLLDVGHVYGLSTRQRFRRILLPAALPQIFAGIEVALPVGIAVMVIANMVGSGSGIGYTIIVAQQSFDIDGTWSGLVLIGLIGCVINLIFFVVQRRVLSWHRGWRALERT